ncbi:MAG: molybdenum cofactor biosynthesis protein MoaE [Hyphomonadaceae bacterium]
MSVLITDAAFDPAEQLRLFTHASKGAGAIVSFTGLVRDTSSTGAVTRLHLQAYDPMTQRGMEDAIDKARGRWPLQTVSIIHRVGDMAPDDPIVFVATASAHRRAAFESADFLMDYLKTEAIFWKKEYTEDSERWIEPRPEDYKDKNRWNS